MFPRTALVILGALLVTFAAVVVIGPLRIGSDVNQAKHMRVVADIQVFSTQLKLYQTMNGSLPSTEQGLRALVQEPTSSPRPARWRQLISGIPPDPWNANYIYRCPGLQHPDGYDLFSAGPDRKPNTTDDDWGE